MRLRYIITFLLAQAAMLSAAAQGTSFAIIIDKGSYEHCQDAVTSYKEAIQKDGLPVFVMADDWQTPEQVRSALMQLKKEKNIEGAVFIGEIPIPMVMKAQFMTSAYKMDESRYPLREVAVPTDRYYDDFDLSFNRLDTEPDGLLHYYELDAKSLPYIQCDIYSARIRPQSSNGDPYAQISAYLCKAAAAHFEHNPFDQFTSYTGEGSYSNCITAWRGERKVVSEQFGDTFNHSNLRMLRFSMDDYMKPHVIRELRRKDLDFMVFHEHGDFFRMYLSGAPEVREPDEYIASTLRMYKRRRPGMAEEMAEKYGFGPEWFADAKSPEQEAADSLTDLKKGIILEEINDIAPNARFVIFDACYNGDFRNPDFIAGKFVMAGGECVAAFANSVNVLQDKSSFDLMGLLGRGSRIGLWAQHINILESHIIGDPTFHFTAPEGQRDINSILTHEDAGYWVTMLDDSDPEIQNIALIRLFENDWDGIADILYEKFRESPYAIVRYNALTLLQRLDCPQFRAALKDGIYDSFEFIRRISAHRMGLCGDEEFLPYLVDAFVRDHNAARVNFNVRMSLTYADPKPLQKAIDDYFANHHYYNAAKDRSELEEIVEKNSLDSAVSTILTGNSGYRMAYISSMRLHPYHSRVPELLALMCDSGSPEAVRSRLADAFAWNELTYMKPQIIEACKNLLADENCPESMRYALQSAVVRLSTKK